MSATGTTWALRTDTDLEGCNRHLPALEAAGLLGIVEEEGRATAYFPRAVGGLPIEGRWEPVAERDWNAEWRASIEPVVVGELAIVPPWLAPPEVPTVLVVEPAQAFGTGHHETTRGCLLALAAEPLAGRTVLDVGTGTGVLAIAAMRLGASTAVAVDTDPVAVATARANALANGADVEVREGSVEAASGAYDLVVANLDTATLARLAGALAARIAPGGRLVASGVSVERADEAVTVLEQAGLVVEVDAGQEWVVLRGRVRRPARR